MTHLHVKDSVVYITFGDGGKTYRYEAVLNRRKKSAEANENRDDNTQKRLREKALTRSRDMPNSRAARADAADWRGFSAILRATDALFAAIFPRKRKRTLTEAEKQSRVMNAAIYVAHHLGYKCGMDGYAQILEIFTKVYFNGKAGRKEVCAKYGLSENAYTNRLLRYRDILEERNSHGAL